MAIDQHQHRLLIGEPALQVQLSLVCPAMGYETPYPNGRHHLGPVAVAI